MALDDILGTIDKRVQELDATIASVSAAKAERKRLKAARKALEKALGQGTSSASERRAARPTTAASDRDRQILAFLKTPRRSSELGKLLGLSAAGALFALRRLEGAGSVKREGDGASIRWVAT